MEIKIVKDGKSKIIYGRYLTENLKLDSELFIRSGANTVFSFLGVITFKVKVLLIYKITMNLISRLNSSVTIDISEESYLNEFLQSIMLWIESGEISTNAKYLYHDHSNVLKYSFREHGWELSNIAHYILGACIYNSDKFIDEALYFANIFILMMSANNKEIHNALLCEIADIVVCFFKSKEYLFML